MEQSEEPSCGFCHTSKADARLLILGPPGHHICDKCVDIAAEVVRTERDGVPPRAAVSPYPRCTFCERLDRRPVVAGMGMGPVSPDAKAKAYICGPCAELSIDVLREDAPV